MENYVTFMPEIFHAGLILDPELRLLQGTENAQLPRNPYIILCREQCATALTNLYSKMQDGAISEVALNSLVHDIIPQNGFSGGMIYTIDPGISMLLPQTVIATPRLKQKTAVDYSLVASNADSIALAFRSIEPMVEYRTCFEKKLITALSGALGFSNRVGVLYLEVPYALFIEDEQTFISTFKAINKTIADCLDLA